MSNIITSLIDPASLQLDGAYVSEQIESQLLPAGPNAGTIFIPGAANWGPVGKVNRFSSYATGVPFYGDTQIGLSSAGVDYGIMARVAMAAAAGCSSFACVRVAASDVAATGSIVAGVSSNIVTITGLYTGSFGNRISFWLTLQSGTVQGYQGAGSTNFPVYRLTVYPPSGNPEVFSNIVAYTGGIGTYSESTFIANLLAAVNGTNNTPSSRWVIASNPSVTQAAAPIPPANPVFLTSGADGTTTLTDASIVGVDGPTGTRSGLYLFREIAKGGTVILPGVATGTGGSYAGFAALSTFCQEETCIGVWGNTPANTNTAAWITIQQTNSLVSQWIMDGMAWVQFMDPATGALRWLEPSAEIAGQIAANPPWLYPGNKPATGLPNIVATEDTLTGVPLSNAEGGEREAAGINWVAKPIPAGNVFGLAHGMMSDGATYCSDVRMANIIALNIQAILAKFVGQMQGTALNDPTRAAARAKVNEYMGTLAGQINGYNDILDNTNNTPLTISEGQMICALSVQTLTPVRFAIGAVQVGAAVQLTVVRQ